jgi:RND family efflux transporter MFP subunit
MTTVTEKPDLSTLRIRRDPEAPNSEKSPKKLLLYGALAVVVIAAIVLAMRVLNNGAAEVEFATASLTFPSRANAVLTASGYVVAQQKAAVASKGTGRLVYLGVEEGDKVRKGEVIARLEDQDVVAALVKSRADLAVAQADSVDATRTLERTTTLYRSGLASRAELDAAQGRFDRVRATIDSYRASVLGAEVSLENTLIRAPFDGTVLTKNADVGEVVSPFAASQNSRAAVVTMADMSSLQVEADVSESNITRVSVEQPCEVVLDAYPEKRYPARVHKIVPTADRTKATVLTKVSFVERDDRVLPEMSAKVTFLSSGSSDTLAGSSPLLMIPSSSVTTRDGKQVVLLVRDGSVVETPVRPGRTFGGSVEILEGLVQGDRVALRPDPGLTSGSKVKLPPR